MPNRKLFPSLCDWLDSEVPAEWLADMLRTVRECYNLDFLLLTKRPETFHDRLWSAAAFNKQKTPHSQLTHWIAEWWEGNSIPPNVWVGVSCEDQQRAEERIPHLLRIPAPLRFLSLEPLLGPIDLTRIAFPTGSVENVLNTEVSELAKPILGKLNGIDWVIVGGESGPKARFCNIEWVRDIIRQCKDADVPCFVKQLGARPIGDGSTCDMLLGLDDPKGGDPAEWPEDLRVREWPTL